MKRQLKSYKSGVSTYCQLPILPSYEVSVILIQLLHLLQEQSMQSVNLLWLWAIALYDCSTAEDIRPWYVCCISLYSLVLV